MDPTAKPSRATPPRFWLAAALAITFLLASAAYLFRRPDNNNSRLQNNARQFIADPIQFATNRFKGGIGAALSINSNSIPQIHNVIKGSPAEAAGLRAADLIIAIDGTPTKGLTLMQTVEKSAAGPSPASISPSNATAPT
jgi:membrane-associated protease RseP (regulator of RpoE activity)